MAIDRDALMQGLIDIGDRGIATEDDAALDAYFAEDFVFHGPGAELSYTELKGNFAAWRAAFDDLALHRDQMLVDDSGEETFMAARTRFTGVFAREFTQSPVGPLPPNGQPVTMSVTNIFRYDREGRLAEEWLQTDNRDLLRQLGAAGG